MQVIWQDCVSIESVPVIWQNHLYMEEYASDLAELPVPVIWQNCLPVGSVPVIWQSCLFVEERASDLAEIPFANDLAELSVCGGGG